MIVVHETAPTSSCDVFMCHSAAVFIVSHMRPRTGSVLTPSDHAGACLCANHMLSATMPQERPPAGAETEH